jgi:hypothetical protein
VRTLQYEKGMEYTSYIYSNKMYPIVSMIHNLTFQFFLQCLVVRWDRVKTWYVGHNLTHCKQLLIMNQDQWGVIGGMIGIGKWTTPTKVFPVPHCPPQIQHDLTSSRTRTAAVGSLSYTFISIYKQIQFLNVLPNAVPSALPPLHHTYKRDEPSLPWNL